ncbi:hypothetical protein Drorol1_Dr00014625 [Drosera rotundifolia]
MTMRESVVVGDDGPVVFGDRRYVLGLDPVSGNYKVVVHCAKTKGYMLVFDFEMRSWRRMRVAESRMGGVCLYVDACIGPEGAIRLVAFDVNEENFEVITIDTITSSPHPTPPPISSYPLLAPDQYRNPSPIPNSSTVVELHRHRRLPASPPSPPSSFVAVVSSIQSSSSSELIVASFHLRSSLTESPYHIRPRFSHRRLSVTVDNDQ